MFSMDKTKRRLLIVGGAGYLGSRLAAELTEFDEVVVTYRTDVPERSAWLATQPRLRAVKFNSKRSCTLPVTGEFGAVINLGLPGAAEAALDPIGSRDAALHATAACRDLVFQGRAQRVIHVSTIHVFGGTWRPRYAESDRASATHAYGENHAACEQLLAMSAPKDTAVLRLTNVIGTPVHRQLGQQSHLVFLDLCRQAATEDTLTLKNDGQSYRDFVPFGDFTAAVRVALALTNVGAKPMHVASGNPLRLDRLAELIRARASTVLQRNPSITYGDGTDNFREPFVVETTTLQSHGWRPSAALESEIDATLRWFR
jgi:nucleoside-diphosphate-sugar epimerase